jgi:molybdate transport system permease protein
VSGYIPTRTATISTTVYQLWREGSDALACRWVLINLVISFLALIAINFLEDDGKSTGKIPAEARKR